jgi:hypothetical protein
VRTVAVAGVLGAVLAASALDLTLGVLWVLALVGVLVLRRRVWLAAPLVLLGAAILLGWGGRLGWFPPPAPESYETGWGPRWAESRAAPPLADEPRAMAAREQLAALGREELRLTGPEIAQRAGAVIALARRLDSLRREAPQEVAAVEASARRLARTLATAEFRNLETRRAAVAAYLAELDRRVTAARDGSEMASVLRAADVAAMAHVSLRPVREDLAAAGAAVESLLRVLGGGVPAATTAAVARYDESERKVLWEVRYAVTGAPRIRLLRLETRAFRSPAPSGVPLNLTYAPGGEGPRVVPPGPWTDLEPAPRSVEVVAAWPEPVVARRVRGPLLRLPAFARLDVKAPAASDDALVTAVVDDRPGIEMPLAVRLPPPRLARLTVPRHALYFADRAGVSVLGPEGDTWIPAGDGGGRLGLELVPRSLFLRNAAFAWVRGYLYRPNPGAMAAAAGAAALTLLLVRRSRPAAVPRR